MSYNYSRKVVLDGSGFPVNGVPYPYTTNQSQNGTPVASSVITLSDKTTVIEVSAIGAQAGSAGIILKWGSASVTATNFDGMVLAGNTRTFVIPVSITGVTSIAGANVANGLYPTLAVKTATAQSCSVFTVEY